MVQNIGPYTELPLTRRTIFLLATQQEKGDCVIAYSNLQPSNLRGMNLKTTLADENAEIRTGQIQRAILEGC